MITSNKQYIAAQEQLAMLVKSLSSPPAKGVPAIIINAHKKQTQELIDEIEDNMEEYNQLRDLQVSDIEINSLNDLFIAPIRYRIASHMSVDIFSQKVGIAPRQIFRYEKECYQNIKASTLQNILDKLELSIAGKVSCSPNEASSDESDSY